MTNSTECTRGKRVKRQSERDLPRGAIRRGLIESLPNRGETSSF
jgi:hypothetical protein